MQFDYCLNPLTLLLFKFFSVVPIFPSPHQSGGNKEEMFSEKVF